MILDAVRDSAGRAIAVARSRLRELDGAGHIAEGLAICPETAACIGALEQLAGEGWITPEAQS